MISVNSIVNTVNDEVYRILWISPDNVFLYLYDINAETFPHKILVKELRQHVADGTYTISNQNVSLNMLPEENIPKKDIAHREQMWEKLSSLLAPENEPAIYERKERGILIQQCIEKSGLTKKTIYSNLRKYWRCGKSKNAFLPDHTRDGGKGTKKHSNKKLGRPNKYGVSTGVYIDEQIERTFEIVIKKYYHTKAEHSFQAVYERMIKDYFSKSSINSDGDKELVVNEPDKIPTIRQFRYWYYKKHTCDETLRYRKGESKFNLNHRAVLGKTDTYIIGPGAKYQIDATVGDIYLVSQFNRADIIGRPIVYFVIDTFSRMITGIYVGLEGPSWIGAMMALSNAASDKVAFCAEYGIEISADEWPCNHVPEVILGDRGEMESKAADTLVNSLGVRIENAPPYRADIKGIVEQYFHTVNTTVTAFLPGNIKPDMHERVGRDYRLDATLDINQFTKVIIECVLYHNNNHFMENYELNEDMVKDEVTPVPINLWKWGITHCSGLLRSFPEDVVKLCLMQQDTAIVTHKGIRFKSIYYLCDYAIDNKWFETARAKGNFKVRVAYDARNMGKIYIVDGQLNTYHVCHLADWQNKYNNKCLEEIIYLQEKEKIAKQGHLHSKLSARVNLSSRVDEIVDEAIKQTKNTPISKSKNERTGNIRNNRKQEKEILRGKEAFNLDEGVQRTETVNVTDNEEDSLYLDLIQKNAEERKHD